MKTAMFSDFNLFTSQEVRTIWTVTNKLRNNQEVSYQQFDNAIRYLDEKKPDLKYDELLMLAHFHGIIDADTI